MLQHVSELHPSLWLNNVPLYRYTIVIYFVYPFIRFLKIHLLFDGYLGYFHFVAVMNFHSQVFIWTYIFNSIGYIPRSVIAGSLGDFKTVSLEVKGGGDKERNRTKQGTKWVKKRHLWKGFFLLKEQDSDIQDLLEWGWLAYQCHKFHYWVKGLHKLPPFIPLVKSNSEGMKEPGIFHWEEALKGCWVWSVCQFVQRGSREQDRSIGYYKKVTPRVLKRWSSGVRSGADPRPVIYYLCKLFNFSWTSFCLSVKLECFYMTAVEIEKVYSVVPSYVLPSAY